MGPKWKKKDLAQTLNGKLDASGVDLLEQSLIYAPNKRVTAKRMMLHEWFDEIREEMIAQFGNVFPHCGSREYQVRRINKARKQKDAQEREEVGVGLHLPLANEDEDITGNAEEWNGGAPKQSMSVDGV